MRSAARLREKIESSLAARIPAALSRHLHQAPELLPTLSQKWMLCWKEPSFLPATRKAHASENASAGLALVNTRLASG